MKICVIGAGPAGLSFADRLKKLCPSAGIDIYEQSEYIGGISKTVVYKGNRIDIGGHRFFSKSDEVMSWWAEKFPIDTSSQPETDLIAYRNSTRTTDGFRVATRQDIEKGRILLLRRRKSRILYGGELYDYPLKLSLDTMKKIGFANMGMVGLSYLYSKLRNKNAENLEDFIISRFGRKLYSMFFESYTEKVWGRKPIEISAAWGAQRIKGLSIRKVLIDMLKKLNHSRSNDSASSISQKGTETSLIERFLYPKLGPGQMWEEVASDLRNEGVNIHLNHKVTGLTFLNGSTEIDSVSIRDIKNSADLTEHYDFYVSTMPISELVEGFQGNMPPCLSTEVQRVARALPYRDFITVGLLLNRLNGPNGESLDDTWIYIQESNVKVGRLQIFNNWSPYLVEDSSKFWVGLEYFCNAGDELWSLSDSDMIELAKNEMAKLGLAEYADIVDATVLREAKTYPAYFDSYQNFDIISGTFDELPNLFLIGRNGMHKYNNQDHSMLSGFRAAELICSNKVDSISKSKLWDINAEQEYHEEK
jgi:protoporphyrinogen oxidase